MAVWGWKWLLKVSGQSKTRGSPAGCCCLRRNQDLNVSGANIGIGRLPEIPPRNLSASPRYREPATELASPGASDASRAHQ